jgi:hypothetical protein
VSTFNRNQGFNSRTFGIPKKSKRESTAMPVEKVPNNLQFFKDRKLQMQICT